MTDPTLQDPLLALRRAIAAGTLPTPTTSPDATEEAQAQHATDDLSRATHLYFTQPVAQTLPLTAATRFVSASTGETPVDLRSIFFAWQKKDVAIPEYIASAQELNEALRGNQPAAQGGDGEGGGGEGPVQVQNLVFVERLDLITWLEGASDDSEYIKPLEGAAAAAAAAAAEAMAAADSAQQANAQAQAQASANIASGAVGGVSSVPASGAGGAQGQGQAAATGGAQGGRAPKPVDPRLQEIYNGERKMGDRNSVLRGIKPTDFSHVRKTAESFLGRNRRPAPVNKHHQQPGSKTPLVPTPSAGLGMPKKHSGHSNPIILLSPSASSLIRMTNVKSFLQDGVFVPPDHPTLSMSTSPNILEIQRPLHPTTASSTNRTSNASSTSNPGSNGNARKNLTRFTLVDSPTNFRPEYWSRLVAVFTTGQTWQFKSYKWSSPPELFKHATGIYVGWRGEEPPREVKGWGRGVEKFAVERWDERGGGVNGAGRWRDRDVVEGLWRVIDEGMRIRGWTGK